MDKIQQALVKLFERHRVVFWYDAKKELRADYEALSLAGVEKIEIQNNEFKIKHKILKDSSEQKYLLYHEGPTPEDIDDWLLDVRLSQGEFRADQAAIWLSELELGLEYSELISTHLEFFKNTKRREKLKSILEHDDTSTMIQQKMLEVCAGSVNADIADILEFLLNEFANDVDEKWKLIERSNLAPYFFKILKTEFNYDGSNPSIKDFTFALFESCYAMQTGRPSKLNTEAFLFLKRWRDSRKQKDVYERLTEQHEELLKIKSDLETRDYRTLVEWNIFKVIEQKILSGLIKDVLSDSLSLDECLSVIRLRRQSHWYNAYVHEYSAIEYSIRFKQELDGLKLIAESFANGVNSYTESWYKIDQYYRKLTFHYRKSENPTLLKPLMEQIGNLYSNKYLMPLNDHWQTHIDKLVRWDAGQIPLQSQFYRRWIAPIVKNENKVVVIISDALRYEAGEELSRLLCQEARIESEIKAAMTLLPSYTQLGMAALLPHEVLSLTLDDTGTVLVDGNSSQGTANRNNILSQKLGPGLAVAEKATEILNMAKEDLRSYLRGYQVIYLYHNRIDKRGDTRDTQDEVFDAVEETFEELIKVIKRLLDNGISNVIVTSDHGFIYQARELDESDFSLSEPSGESVFKKDRRFVLGKGLKRQSGLKDFRSEDFGLAPGMEIQIPKSICRIRLQGSGSRYVHGGASLQEITIPILEVKKKRESTNKKVEVDIIRRATTTITTGQLTVYFYQCDPVDDKIQKHELRAGIYTKTDPEELISDSHELIFDMVSEDKRAREIKVQFVLSKTADKYNGQEVVLKLEEKLDGTGRYVNYKSCNYVVRRSFTSDFDL